MGPPLCPWCAWLDHSGVGGLTGELCAGQPVRFRAAGSCSSFEIFQRITGVRSDGIADSRDPAARIARTVRQVG